jgi:tetratricopeptide (TPR) repeat protein
MKPLNVNKLASALFLFFTLSLFFSGSNLLLGGTKEGDELADLGANYYGLRRFVDALGVLKKAVRIDPQNDKALYYLGMIYRDTDNYERADSYFRRALHYNSKNSAAMDEVIQLHYNLAKQYSNDGNVNDAIKELNLISSLNVFSLDCTVFLMSLYDSKQDYESMVALTHNIDGHSNSVVGDETVWGSIYYFGGTAAYKLKDFGLAEKWFENSMKSNSEHPGARAAYDQVRSLQKKKLLPILKKGDELARDGNYSEAVEVYKIALAVDIDNSTIKSRIEKAQNLVDAGALLMAAEKFENDGQWVKAYDLLEQASQRSPGDPDILGRLQRIEKVLVKLQEKQKRDEALRLSAEREEKGKIKSLYDRADFAAGREKYAEAIELYNELLKLVPDDKAIESKIKKCAEAGKIIELFESGKNKFDRKQFEGALADFEALRKESAYSSRISIYIARCYLGMNSLVKAEKALKDILDADKSHKEALMLLADLYYSQIAANSGNIARSLAYYNRLMQIDPENLTIKERISELSWQIHRTKYLFIIFLLVASVLAYGYLKFRPALLRKSLLRSLEKYAVAENWEKIRNLHKNVESMKFTPLEEAQARYIFARAFYERGFLKQATKECQELIRLKRITKKGRLLLARIYYATKAISPEVLDLYMELLTEERTDISLRNFVADFCASKKIINPTTLPLLRQFAVDSPDNSDLRSLLVKACQKSGDRGSAAMSIFKIEAEKNPDNVDVRAIIAEELMKSDRLEEAISACEEIINLSLNHRKTHEVLLAAYGKMDKLSDLAATYQTILEHDPHNAVINSFLRRILHPDGEPERTPEMEAGGFAGDGGWMDQMPAGFAVEHKDSGKKIDGPDDGQQGNAVGTGALPCKKCGRPVPVGSYFCECGHPL